MLEAVSGQAHNLEVGGSIPPSATKFCPGGGMVDTLVLEANVERRASSSLAWGTKLVCGYGVMVTRDLAKV